MLRFCIALSLALLAVVYRPAPARAALADCQRLLTIGPELTADSVFDEGDVCHFTGLQIAVGRYVGWRADKATVSPVGPNTASSGTLPHTLVLEAQGVRYHGRTPSKIANYITGVIARPFAIRLDYALLPGTLPGDADMLRLYSFSLNGPAFGVFEIGATLTGIKADEWARGGAPDPARVGLASLDLRLDNAGAFEVFVVPWVAPMLWRDAADPEAAASADRIKAGGFAGGLLKQAGASAETVSAVMRFIASLPHPSGHFALHAVFTPPLTAAEVIPMTSSLPEPATLQKLAGIVSSYTP